MDYRLSLRIASQAAQAAHSILTQEIKREWGERFPCFEIWYIVSMNASGTYNLRNKNSSQTMRAVRNIARTPTYLVIDEAVVVGFDDYDRNKPFIIMPGGFTLSAVTHNNLFISWLRVGAAMFYRFLRSEWDDLSDNTRVVFSGSGLLPTAGHIVRTTSDGILWWADGNHLRSRDLSESLELDPASTDLEAEIVAMSIGNLSGRTYTITQVPGEIGGGGDSDYALGYAAALALFDGEFAYADPGTQGVNDCLTEAGYQAPDLITFFLTGDYPPPSGESEEYQNGWTDGFTTYYTAQYDSGYEGGGCEVPS